MSDNVDTPVLKSSCHKANDPDVQSTMLPTGFTTICGPNRMPAIIEQYMVLATATAFDGLHYKDLFKIDRGAAGLRDLESYELVLLANGTVNSDPSPALSQREYLDLHAKVKAMMDHYGLTYKDAAHHLYLAEVEKVKALTDSTKIIMTTITCIEENMSQSVEIPQDVAHKDAELSGGHDY